MALNLRLGWDLVQRADQAKAEKMLSDEKPQLLIFESYVPVSLSLDCNTQSQTSWQTCGRRANVSPGVCMQSCKIAHRARLTRSLRVSLGGVRGAVLVEAEVD